MKSSMLCKSFSRNMVRTHAISTIVTKVHHHHQNRSRVAVISTSRILIEPSENAAAISFAFNAVNRGLVVMYMQTMVSATMFSLA